MGENIYEFNNLSPEMQCNLRFYIADNFSKTKHFNTRHTAYGLKQHFTSQYGNKDEHVTSQCFMEAMLEAGFQAKEVPHKSEAAEPNWYFNVSTREIKY